MSDVAWMLGDGVSHDANVPRWATAALAGDVGGVCGPGHLAVSQDDTPGMRVKVAAGYVLVRGGSTPDQGMYAWWYPGGTVDVAPGDPSNPRDTIIGVQVDDDFWDASGENRCRLVAVDGTPAGAPVDPSLPPSFTRLARVRVDQNESTSILNAKITNLRTLAGATTPVRAEATFPSGLSGPVYVTRIPTATTPMLIVAGLITNGTGSAITTAATLATLPSGWRPTAQVNGVAGVNNNTGASAGLVIQTNGVIRLGGQWQGAGLSNTHSIGFSGVGWQ